MVPPSCLFLFCFLFFFNVGQAESCKADKPHCDKLFRFAHFAGAQFPTSARDRTILFLLIGAGTEQLHHQ